MSDVIPLTGEPLALDLVNTRTAVGDLLAAPDDLRAWLDLQADRLPEARDAGSLDIHDVRAIQAVREHVANAVERARRGERPDGTDLDALNDAQRAAPAITELTWDGSAVAALRRRSGPWGARLAAGLAEAAAGLLADPAVTRIRQCAADDCVLLFLPAHPRRRWCSAARCGNRVRVARHYRRHKSG
ncbi:CGNR zinc finger domain-containing protein [Actinomadura opuntiae]|uniref:CGNR zinc finger domain-containing protein n=1 Tax=Actinomadura sp. OS1-43 TaxID=604315 RepID=UPI00255A7E1D|nr:CGNR zinc finger domain-containing protein [Actinomadura sp. OS1-43]MDL4815236.1 CGNR zinc finger domain-containing protein [Actinomadura sp. OS1-43]